MYLINTKCLCHCLCGLSAVSGQHDCMSDTYLFHVADRLFCSVFNGVGDDNRSFKYSIVCHINNGSHALARCIKNTL